MVPPVLLLRLRPSRFESSAQLNAGRPVRTVPSALPHALSAPVTPVCPELPLACFPIFLPSVSLSFVVVVVETRLSFLSPLTASTTTARFTEQRTRSKAVCGKLCARRAAFTHPFCVQLLSLLVGGGVAGGEQKSNNGKKERCSNIPVAPALSCSTKLGGEGSQAMLLRVSCCERYWAVRATFSKLDRAG